MNNNLCYYFGKLYQLIRVVFFSVISSKNVKTNKNQPVVFEGKGIIKIGENVTFGVRKSPLFFSGYSYIESRNETSEIIIGNNCFFNNSATIISNSESIIIGDNCLIGINFQVIDSDFHNVDPKRRFEYNSSIPPGSSVLIGNNVFIGNNVTILKGVKIGDNSVIANGSIVSKSIPSNVIAGGNTAKVIREI